MIIIKRSEINASGIKDFVGKAAEYAVHLKEWMDHEKRVAADRISPPKDPMLAHHPWPKPQAHPLIARTLDENFQAVFEIEEDVNVLLLKKSALFAALSLAEEQAREAVVPFGLRRRLLLNDDKYARKDAETRDRIGKNESRLHVEWMEKAKAAADKNSSFLGKIKEAIGKGEEAPPPPDAIDLDKAVSENRTEDHAKHLELRANQNDRLEEIHERVADAMVEIEALTEETIGAYKLPVL